MNRIAFLVNGGESSAMGQRARAFADRLADRFEVRTLHRSERKLSSIRRFATELGRFRPAVCYVFDMAFSGVLAGVIGKHLTGCRLVVDTGDAITELARAMGRGRVGLACTRLLETVTPRLADRVVVRGTFHQKWLTRHGTRADLIPDGVETDQFAPMSAEKVRELRDRHGLGDALTVGLLGSSTWSEKRQSCYGWDLIEAVRLLRDEPVRGVMIGGGSGIPVLKARCRQYGIEDRVAFLGQVPYDRLPRELNLIDVALSTQTDDRIGRFRTTGKLPLYMASGRYVLASKLGEASLVLPEEMLVPFEGSSDPGYPEKLADQIRRLLVDRGRLDRGLELIPVARRRFDYDVLAPKLAAVIESVRGGAG